MVGGKPWYLRPGVWLAAIPVLSILLHLHIFTRPLVGPHVWRQSQTQTVILNFSRGNMDVLSPRSNNFNRGTDVQRMEFPVYQWMAAGLNRLLGENLLWSRMLNFLIGLWGIYGIYRLLQTQTHNNLKAALGAWAFAWSPVFHYYTLNPMPDVLALSAMIWAIWGMFRYADSPSSAYALITGGFLSLAMAAKLPFVLSGAIWAWLMFLQWRRGNIVLLRGVLHTVIIILLLIPPGIWYAMAIPTWKGNGIVGGAITESASFGLYAEVIFGTLTSHLPELLLNYGAVPFFIAGCWSLWRKKGLFTGWNAGLLAFLAYFIYEVPMIGLVHDYYLLPFLPFLFQIVMLGIGRILDSGNQYVPRIGLAVLLLLPGLAFLRCMERWNMDKPRMPQGLFSEVQVLKQAIPAGSLVLVGNDPSTHIWLYQLDRKGYTFEFGIPDTVWLAGFQGKGVSYLVTDCADTAKQDIRAYLGKPLAESRGIRVYRLGN